MTAPVLADATKAIAAALSMDPKAVPGKCVLSPEMVILGCYVGADDAPGFAIITAHASN